VPTGPEPAAIVTPPGARALMNQPPETPTLRDSLRVLRRYWLIIALATVIGGGVALAISSAQDKKYEATSTIALTPDFFVNATDQAAQATAEIGFADNDRLFQRVTKLTGIPPAQLHADLDTSFQAGSTIVNYKATSTNPEQAARIANEFARAADVVGNVITKAEYLRLARIQSDPTLRKQARNVDAVEIVQLAPVPTSAVSPKPGRDAFLGACLGFILGLGIAFLRQALDRRVSSVDDVRRALNLPLLGYVRGDTLGRVGMFANGLALESGQDLDAFRIVRTNVGFLGGEEPLTTLAVTSALPEEGKSTVAAGLAYANALAGRRTLLVECDLRRPMAAERLGLDSGPGLSDHLAGKAKPSDVLRSVEVKGQSAENLAVIPAGTEVVQPAELIASPRFAEFIAETSEAYDSVVLDCAPLLPVGDTLELLPRVDGVILCVRLGQTTHDQARAAKDALGHLPARPTGLVITGLGRGGEDDYAGYYSTRAQAPAAE
jgi:capsular exopolysaccharide synthesis family protein